SSGSSSGPSTSSYSANSTSSVASGSSPPASAPASTSSAAATAPLWPQIRVVAGQIPRIVTEAESALLGYGGNIYHRGGRLVIPVEIKYAASDDREDRGWQLIEISKPEMIHILSRAAQFWKFDGRMHAWKVIDPPEVVAETYLARRGRWKLPVLV